QGARHITDDIDVAYARARENLKALAAALAPLHPRLRGAPPDLPFVWDARTLRAGSNFTLVTDAADLDVLGDVAGVDSFEGLWERAVEMELFGLAIRVASLEDLIRMKRAADRPQDRHHVMELERLKALIEGR